LEPHFRHLGGEVPGLDRILALQDMHTHTLVNSLFMETGNDAMQSHQKTLQTFKNHFNAN